MTPRRGAPAVASARPPAWVAVAVLMLLLCGAGVVQGQPRTDVVTLANGDRITGEIKRMDRGQLEFKTDDAGTIEFEWNKLASIEARRRFEVSTKNGDRYLGSLGLAPDRAIAVADLGGITVLPMAEVTEIVPIGASLWRRLDGSIDAGFSYTRSSGIAQLNVNSSTVYRRPAFEARLSASGTGTQTEGESGRDDRGYVEASYLRYRWQRWFVSAAARFESNESLGMRLRSQLGGSVGPRLVNTNRAQVTAGGGLVVNDERGVDSEPTQNLEGLLMFQSEYFTYDRPRTDLSLRVQYFTGISDAGRRRVQLEAAAKRELWKDLFLALNVYDSYDSRPPAADANANDVGVSFSIGWTY